MLINYNSRTLRRRRFVMLIKWKFFCRKLVTERSLIASFTVYGILNTIQATENEKQQQWTWASRKIYVVLIEVQFTLLSVITSVNNKERL